MDNQQTVLWEPSQDFQKQAHLHAYRTWLQEEKGLCFDAYADLWKWSVREIEAFWESIWQYFEIMSHSPYQQVLESRNMPGATWFPGARLNYAEHIFRKKSADRPALVLINEQGKREMSWGELEQEVKAVRIFLEQSGIQQGDCVAAFLPNIPETIACFLAVNSLGAVWSCCSPDFGVDTVVERFAQIGPKVFICADGYQYNGKPYDRRKEIEAIRSQLPSLGCTLFIPYQDPNATLEDSTPWSAIMEPKTGAALEFTPVPFDHPIWVLYSSGTTGKPKAITHSHGGVLLEHYKYLAFHNDVHEGENFFWFTTTGWMMWNFLQASMLMGATPILYDGSPGYPNLDVLWKWAAELPIHHLGTSAPYLTACMKRGLSPKTLVDLSALRSIGSTGAPLPAEAFDWVYQEIKKDLWLCSMSGGTDVCTAFVGGNPLLPVYKGAIQSRALGCALYAYDLEGNRVENELGEMVIEAPMPSMPIYFWNDPEGKRYQASYFDGYPGKWQHGDYIQLFDNGSLVIHGRSDATLNRKGVRIGTAEIYGILDKIPGIADSLVLNLEQQDGSDYMPLFIVLAPEAEWDSELEEEIRTKLRSQGSPRHVPDEILLAPDIPYTLSGKKMEVPVKKLCMGLPVNISRDAMRNPDSMDFFESFSQRRKS